MISNTMRKCLTITLILAVLLGIALVTHVSDKAFGTTGESVIVVYTKQSKYLMPKKARKKYRYKSEKPKVISVTKKGKIKAKKAGEVVVVATNKKNASKIYFRVTAYKKIKKFKLKNPNRALYIGETLQIRTTPTLSKSYEPLYWSSSNNKLAKVSKTGAVSAVSKGKVTITARTRKKVTASVTLEIREVPALSWNQKELVIDNRYAQQLSLDYGNVPSKYVKYHSSHSSVVSVDKQGVIVAQRPGKAQITATVLGKKSPILTIRAVEKNGMLKDSLIKTSKAAECNKLMIVAHPDDEALWGCHHMLQGGWFVVCLTNGWNQIRSNEYRNVLKATGSKGVILDYPDTLDGIRDTWEDVDTGMMKDLNKIIGLKQWDCIATYNPDGVTGHIHHRLTYEKVRKVITNRKLENKFYYFGRFYTKDNMPDGLPRLSEEDAKRKADIIALYPAEKKPIALYWAQMIPYENWILSTDWGTENELRDDIDDTSGQPNNNEEGGSVKAIQNMIKNSKKSLIDQNSAIMESPEVDDNDDSKDSR